MRMIIFDRDVQWVDEMNDFFENKLLYLLDEICVYYQEKYLSRALKIKGRKGCVILIKSTNSKIITDIIGYSTETFRVEIEEGEQPEDVLPAILDFLCRNK